MGGVPILNMLLEQIPWYQFLCSEPEPENVAVCCNAPRINKLNSEHKREHHFFTFMGNTIFSIRVSPMFEGKLGRMENSNSRVGNA